MGDDTHILRAQGGSKVRTAKESEQGRGDHFLRSIEEGEIEVRTVKESN